MADIKTQTKGTAHEDHGTGRYYLIWLVLLAATALTVVTGRMNFGAANIYIAMTIASIKALLVLLFFMHLWDEGGVNRLVLAVSVLFVLVLLAGVFGDVLVRRRISLPNMGPMPHPTQVESPSGGGH